MLKPKPFTVKNMDGEDIDVILSRLPAVVGREIAAKYPMANLPKLGDYAVSQETMYKLMSYVAVPSPVPGADPIVLKLPDLINAHLRDAETLMQVEMAMLEYNFSFFRKGRISDFLGEFVQMIAGKIIAMSIQSSEPSSAAAEQPSTSSEQSTISRTPS